MGLYFPLANGKSAFLERMVGVFKTPLSSVRDFLLVDVQTQPDRKRAFWLGEFTEVSVSIQ